MTINIIASGSSGNTLALSDGNTTVLIDCGLPINVISRNTLLSNIHSCLLTHAHLDHSLALPNLLSLCIPCYAPQSVLEHHNATDNYFAHIVKPHEPFVINTLAFSAFELPHNNTDGTPCENYGYLIYSKRTKEYSLFATDYQYIPHSFPPCSYYIMECNYDESYEYMPEIDERSVEKRRYKSHASLQTVIKFLQSQDLSKCKQIYLTHCSNDMGNKQDFITKIKAIVPEGVEVL